MQLLLQLLRLLLWQEVLNEHMTLLVLSEEDFGRPAYNQNSVEPPHEPIRPHDL